MRTEAIVESFEASLREAFQQLQGGADAIPWWERKSLAQGMTESFVVGTASETAFLLVALLAKDPKWEVRAAIADLLPVLPEAESKRLTDQLMADSNTYVRRSVDRSNERSNVASERFEPQARHASQPIRFHRSCKQSKTSLVKPQRPNRCVRRVRSEGKNHRDT